MSKTFDQQKAVSGLYNRLGTWRKVAAHIGSYSDAYWCLVSHGMRPTRRAENVLRRRLGLAPRGVTRVSEMPTRELAWYLVHRRPLAWTRVEGGGPQARISDDMPLTRVNGNRSGPLQKGEGVVK